MANRLFLQPPEILPVNQFDPLIFLGGPIQGAPKWQYDARGIIHGINSGIIVASPRKEYAKGTFDYEGQVGWERHHLRRAGFGVGAILFYLPKQVTPPKMQRFRNVVTDLKLLATAEGREIRAYGQTSRFEMGWWFTEHSHDPSVALAVGMPGGFGNERYLIQHIEKECSDVIINRTLEETCMQAVRLALEKTA